MLYNLLSFMDRDRFALETVSLTDIGPLGDKIRSLNIPVEALGMRRGAPDPRAIFRLSHLLHRRRPSLIQTWMYHADLMGGIAAKMAGGIPLVWGIHNSDLDPETSKRMTIRTARICARLSHWLPKSIVCCSEASREVHTRLGYDPAKMVTIQNGFDLAAFRPDKGAGCLIRHELGIPENSLIIGLAARFDPQKDHQNFVRAADLMKRSNPEVHFLLCGDGVTWDNRSLAEWIDDAGMRDCFHLLGRRDDMTRIQASLDIAVSASSYGEAFPLVLGEAMACGVPCVATDVGDSALIIGDTGRVVSPQDPAALAAAWRELIEMGPENRVRLGEAARKRIAENFSLPVIAARYEKLYKEIVKQRG